MPRKIVERITARGHENIRATHGNTLEITKEGHLTPRGDCIVAVSADRGFPEFSDNFKNALRNKRAILRMTIECSGVNDEIIAYGHPELRFKSPEEMVIRKSSFICDRTLAIRANKAAIDLNRNLIEKLRRGNPVNIKLEVIYPNDF
ncbi:MAG TPA: DUF371 domain-containing protein [Candidatus Altiarchaeales archaeon]|nr:DUF371 domain-containing protein [Candidatus Altiarchaeales archaeon]HEX54885.1 DUF371 domain-containing protein [Candidatus Altiarchaeales archaeon]